MIVLLAALAFAEDLEGALETTWEAARTDATWRSPYAAERTALREGLARLAAGAATCDAGRLAEARALLAPADLVVEAWEGPVWIVRERLERRGAGLVAIRCGEAEPWVWQAPHAMYDLETGEIVRHLFVESGARAAMWNTVHRYRSTPAEAREDAVHPADVTREHGSLFHAATVGLAVGDPGLRFVQVHGFDRDSVPHDAIVSTGRADAPPTALATALGVLGSVGAYGADAEALGGTVNVQGKMLAAFPGHRFLHLELDRDLRRRLAEDADLRKRLVDGLRGATW